MKRDNGITLIKLILSMLIIIAIGVAVYEIVLEDVFGIMGKESTPISTMSDLKNQIIQKANSNSNSNKNKIENVEKVTPILEENNQQAQEISSGVKHYYYEQLDDNAKIIYKGLEENIENMKNGTYKIDFGKQFNSLINSSNGEQKLNIAFQSAWNAFTYDYVDIFYIDVTKLVLTTQTTTIATYSTHKVGLSSGNNGTYLSDGFTSYEKVKGATEYIENIRKQVVSKLKGYSEYEQIKHLHNWLVDNVEYDTTYKKGNIHNVYGVFKNEKAVCEGYARAFKYILDELGIPCVLVSGTATNSKGETESHAWNYVQIDNKWYAIDVTWDDPVLINGSVLTNNIRYKYFLKGSNEFLSNHKEDGYISAQSIKFTFPKLEKGNYE